MFAIDTGNDTPERPIAKSTGVDETMRVSLKNGQRAERLHRQIIENLEACETVADLEAYVTDEAPLLDSMREEWPEFHDRIQETFEPQRCIL